MIYIDAKILFIISLIYLNEYSELKEIQKRHQWREKKQLVTANLTQIIGALAPLINGTICLNVLGQIVIVADPNQCATFTSTTLSPNTPTPSPSTPPGNPTVNPPVSPPVNPSQPGTPPDNSGIASILQMIIDLISGVMLKDIDCSIPNIEGKCMLPSEAQILCNGATNIYCNSTQCPGNLKCCLNTQKTSSELTSDVTATVIKMLSQMGFLNSGGPVMPSLPGSNQYPYSPPYSSYPSYPVPMYPNYSKTPPSPQYGGK